MSKLAKTLELGKFVVTVELNPPKGTNLGSLMDKARLLSKTVDAFNLTDSHRSQMSMSPLSTARLLVENGLEPILQVTGRDRNRIAIQGDLLGAHALGISNVVCMTGDHPKGGDHPEATPVFDLDGIQILQAISMLSSGTDLGGNKLEGNPEIFAGGVVNPGAYDLDQEIRRMSEKIDAGAKFFQTQSVFDAAKFERFVNRVHDYNVPIIAGHIMLKSAGMARRFNESLPGVEVPDEIIRELSVAENRKKQSAKIMSRIVKEIRPMCQGVHIMAIGWESEIPNALQFLQTQ